MNQEVDIPFGRRASKTEALLAEPSQVSPTGGMPKRILDVIFSLIGLILFSPFLIVTAISIKLCDGGPVFFSHTRVGFLGRPFRCLKFRTMAIDADEKLNACLTTDARLAIEWAAKRKLRNDPRLIPIGAALRRSSLDELPQLINILRGEMSLVGPRPVVAEELAYYGAGRRVVRMRATRLNGCMAGGWTKRHLLRDSRTHGQAILPKLVNVK